MADTAYAIVTTTDEFKRKTFDTVRSDGAIKSLQLIYDEICVESNYFDVLRPKLKTWPKAVLVLHYGNEGEKNGFANTVSGYSEKEICGDVMLLAERPGGKYGTDLFPLNIRECKVIWEIWLKYLSLKK